MSIHKTEGIVLNRRDFRETSLIAHFYTRDFGKVSGLLKGIRKEPVKFASPVELFSLNEIIFYRKRNSSLHLVSQCDVREGFYLIRESMSKIGVASVMMEITDAVMPSEDKNEEVFDLLLGCLRELENNSSPEKIRMIFTIKLLALSGFKPHFDSCVACGNRIINESKFSLALGGLLCERCYRRDTAARSIFKGTVATILYIQRNDFKSNLNLGLNPQIKKELDLVLNSFLTFHLQKQFKAQKVLDKLEDLAVV